MQLFAPSYSTIPAETVSALLAAHPSTRAELDVIRDPREPSRYQSVYGHVHGGRYDIHSYRARVLKFYELGSGFPSTEDAARAVVAFYKGNFGDRWARAFRYRKVTPWRLRRLRNGFGAEVYLRGTPIGVTHADAHGRAPGASERWTWPTPDAAKEAARLAMRRWFERDVRALTVPHPGLLFWRG